MNRCQTCGKEAREGCSGAQGGDFDASIDIPDLEGVPCPSFVAYCAETIARRKALSISKRWPIPARYAAATVAAPPPPPLRTLWPQIVAAARLSTEPDPERRPSSVTLVSRAVGSGKTFAACAILRAAADAGAVTAYAAVPELLARLRSTYSEDSGEDASEVLAIRSVGVLVLDDLGAAKSSDWAEEQLFLIVNHRYEQRLLTIVTTNLGLDELAKRHEQSARIASRLRDDSMVISFPEVDLRRRAPAA